MQKTTLSILLVLFSIFITSCSNHKEVSKTEFINTVLHEVDVNTVEVKNNEILIHTVEQETYNVDASSMTRGEINEFVNTIRAKNEHIGVHYNIINPGSNSPVRYLLDFIPLLFPLLFFTHIILLWIALKRIIRSEVDNTET